MPGQGLPSYLCKGERRQIMACSQFQHVPWLAACVLLSVGWSGCGAGKEDGKTKAPSAALKPFLKLEGQLDIAGGTAHIPVMEEAQRRIMNVNPKVRISVAGGGSGQGVKQVSAGLVHIGNTGRALTADEIRAGDLKTFPFAVDGVAVVVHPRNKVRSLTTKQIKDLFAGRITSWKVLGGDDRAVNLFGRKEGSGTRKTFWSNLLDKEDIGPATNVVESNGAMKTAVANDPGAVGYLSIGHVDETVAAVAVDGVKPTQENAADSTYKVTRKIYMNTKGEPTGLTRLFIDYILSEEGAEIIRNCKYIPLSE